MSGSDAWAGNPSASEWLEKFTAPVQAPEPEEVYEEPASSNGHRTEYRDEDWAGGVPPEYQAQRPWEEAVERKIGSQGWKIDAILEELAKNPNLLLRSANLRKVIEQREKDKRREQAKEGPTWRKRFRHVSEIIDEPDEEVSFHVDGLIPAGWAGMICADSKTGKTLLALQIAQAIGRGIPFLGRAVQKGTCVLALVDDPRVLSKKRIKETFARDDDIYPFIERWDEQCLLDLEECVKETKPSFVLIDTMVKVGPRGAGAENDAPQMDALIERFTHLTLNGHTTVCFLHHNSYAGRARGSTAIPGAAPFILNLKTLGINPDGQRVVQAEMDWKLAPIPPFMLCHTNAGFVIHEKPRSPEAEDRARMEKLLSDGKPRTIKEMAKALETSEYLAQKDAATLINTGRLIKHGTKKVGKHHVDTFVLAARPEDSGPVEQDFSPEEDDGDEGVFLEQLPL